MMKDYLSIFRCVKTSTNINLSIFARIDFTKTRREGLEENSDLSIKQEVGITLIVNPTNCGKGKVNSRHELESY